MTLITEPPDHGIGRSRGGLSTKIHHLVDGNGMPLVVVCAPGQAGDAPMFPILLGHLHWDHTHGIPFFLGGIMALAFVGYYLKSVRESELFEGSGGGGTPVKDLFTGQNRKNFIQVFVLMTGFWLTLNCVTAILPGLLSSESNLTPTQVSVTLIVAYLVVAVCYSIAPFITYHERAAFVAELDCHTL